jgi:hypothetical protein
LSAGSIRTWTGSATCRCFRYYGSAIENGIDPLSFLGVSVVAIALAAAGSALFERRDLFS